MMTCGSLADVQSDAADFKENQQQAGNVALPQPSMPSRQSGDPAQGKQLSSGAAVSKTRKSARLSGTRPSTSSARQDSAEAAPTSDQLTAQSPAHPDVDTGDSSCPGSSAAEPVTQDPDAQDSILESAGCQDLALAEPASHEPPAERPLQPAVTPMKAAQAKASGDDLT